jgi:hypothetical protein
LKNSSYAAESHRAKLQAGLIAVRAYSRFALLLLSLKLSAPLYRTPDKTDLIQPLPAFGSHFVFLPALHGHPLTKLVLPFNM